MVCLEVTEEVCDNEADRRMTVQGMREGRFARSNAE